MLRRHACYASLPCEEHRQITIDSSHIAWPHVVTLQCSRAHVLQQHDSHRSRWPSACEPSLRRAWLLPVHGHAEPSRLLRASCACLAL